jgi:multidrug efflux pump
MELMRQCSQARFTDVFVERPILSIVIAMLLVLLGVRAASTLPVLQYPVIESSSLVITTPYIGASAEVVQGFITDRVERAAAAVPGVDYVDSTTKAGLSTVTAWLELNENSSSALAELSARLDQIRFELPAGAEDPAVSVVRADRTGAGFYLDVILDGQMSRAEVTDYLMRRVSPILTAIEGVQRVGIEGGRLPAMRIWLDPVKLAMFNVSTLDVERALLNNNVIATIGRSENSHQRIDLLVDTSLQGIDDFERMIIRREADGALIRIRDVARVALGEEEGDSAARLNQQDAVYLSIWPLPGANEISIADDMYVALEQINPTLPDGLHIGIGYDVTRYMRAALREIFITLGETVLLVGLVVVLMMGSIRTALVPLAAIPISLLGAVAAMSAMGFSLNLLTVLAIVLAVGLVVDDAIVVVENVARYMRAGMTRRQAALASSRQLMRPIIGMTITLAAVYTPIGFLSGLTGVLFKEFAFTLAMAVLISGLVALTLSPIMSAWVSPEGGRESRFTRRVNAGFERLQRNYGRLLDHSFKHQPQILTIALFCALLAWPFYHFSRQELAPVEDEGMISVIVEAPPEASLAYTHHYMTDVVNAMATLPGADFMWQVVLPIGGFGGMVFDDFDQREHNTQTLLQDAFNALGGVSGLRAYPVLPPALPTAGNFDVELVVLSPDSHQDMLPYAGKMVRAAMASGAFMFADTDLRVDLPQGRYQLNRERVADLGMNLDDVSRQLGLFLSANYINRFDFHGKAYQVIPMVETDGRPDPNALLDLKIRTPNGDLVPLSALAQLEQHAAPRILGKFQQKNSFRIYGGVIPGRTKAQALAALERAAAEQLPAHYDIDYAGESRQLRQEGNTLTGVLAMALAFVLFVLAVQFNSFRDPLVVLLGSVPLALSGAMLFTFLDWTTINIFSQVGFITLVGLVSKNAILIVEFANQLQAEGRSRYNAIHEAATTRLRPVLMTTGATVFGHFPLVLVSGPGAEARNSIGIILVAGMTVGTVFTLFILPNVYMALASSHRETKPDTSDPSFNAA